MYIYIYIYIYTHTHTHILTFHMLILQLVTHSFPLTVAARFKVYFCGRLVPGIADWNHPGGMEVGLLCLLYDVHAAASVKSRSLVKGSPTCYMCLCVSNFV